MASTEIILNEEFLDISYIPEKLWHRDQELSMLESIFSNMINTPYAVSQKAIMIGDVGSGKTVLAQFYGKRLRKEAEKKRRVKAEYIHVNCRELRGSLFMILNRVVQRIKPEFPERGYSANELLDIIKQILDEVDTQILLCLDEVDYLIEKEGSDALYYLTRFHESDPEKERRLNLLFISKNPEVFEKLDRSTLSSLQRNVVVLPDYEQGQLTDILNDRVRAAFRENTVPVEVIEFISEVTAANEHGDARYAISLLSTAGRVAANNDSSVVMPEHVRKAATGVLSPLHKEPIKHLSPHEKLVLLAVARFFDSNPVTAATTGEVEQQYHLVCEERSEKPRGHTQFWKYLKNLQTLDIINISLRNSSQGRTQLIRLDKVSAEQLEETMEKMLE